MNMPVYEITYPNLPDKTRVDSILISDENEKKALARFKRVVGEGRFDLLEDLAKKRGYEIMVEKVEKPESHEEAVALWDKLRLKKCVKCGEKIAPSERKTRYTLSV